MCVSVSWRSDLRCGAGYDAPDGSGNAICNPTVSAQSCCSTSGTCIATGATGCSVNAASIAFSWNFVSCAKCYYPNKYDAGTPTCVDSTGKSYSQLTCLTRLGSMPACPAVWPCPTPIVEGLGDLVALDLDIDQNIFTIDAVGNQLYYIDANTGAILATWSLPATPLDVFVSDETDQVFVLTRYAIYYVIVQPGQAFQQIQTFIEVPSTQMLMGMLNEENGFMMVIKRWATSTSNTYCGALTAYSLADPTVSYTYNFGIYNPQTTCVALFGTSLAATPLPLYMDLDPTRGTVLVSTSTVLTSFAINFVTNIATATTISPSLVNVRGVVAIQPITGASPVIEAGSVIVVQGSNDTISLRTLTAGAFRSIVSIGVPSPRDIVLDANMALFVASGNGSLYRLPPLWSLTNVVAGCAFSALTVSPGVLVPTFNAAIRNYSLASVAWNTNALSVVVTAADATARVFVRYNAAPLYMRVTPLMPLPALSLAVVGPQHIDVRIVSRTGGCVSNVSISFQQSTPPAALVTGTNETCPSAYCAPKICQLYVLRESCVNDRRCGWCITEARCMQIAVEKVVERVIYPPKSSTGGAYDSSTGESDSSTGESDSSTGESDSSTGEFVSSTGPEILIRRRRLLSAEGDVEASGDEGETPGDDGGVPPSRADSSTGGESDSSTGAYNDGSTGDGIIRYMETIYEPIDTSDVCRTGSVSAITTSYNITTIGAEYFESNCSTYEYVPGVFANGWASSSYLYYMSYVGGPELGQQMRCPDNMTINSFAFVGCRDASNRRAMQLRLWCKPSIMHAQGVRTNLLGTCDTSVTYADPATPYQVQYFDRTGAIDCPAGAALMAVGVQSCGSKKALQWTYECSTPVAALTGGSWVRRAVAGTCSTTGGSWGVGVIALDGYVNLLPNHACAGDSSFLASATLYRCNSNTRYQLNVVCLDYTPTVCTAPLPTALSNPNTKFTMLTRNGSLTSPVVHTIHKYECVPGTGPTDITTPGLLYAECQTTGKFDYTGTFNCSRCAPGYYSGDSSFNTCRQCDAGTFANNPGSTTCLGCSYANCLPCETCDIYGRCIMQEGFCKLRDSTGAFTCVKSIDSTPLTQRFPNTDDLTYDDYALNYTLGCSYCDASLSPSAWSQLPTGSIVPEQNRCFALINKCTNGQPSRRTDADYICRECERCESSRKGCVLLDQNQCITNNGTCGCSIEGKWSVHNMTHSESRRVFI